jgi:hypothetical protein
MKRLTVTDREGEKHVFDGGHWNAEGNVLMVFRPNDSWPNAVAMFRDWGSFIESEVEESRKCISCCTESGLLKGDLCVKCQSEKYKAQEG